MKMKRFAALMISAALVLSGYVGSERVSAASDASELSATNTEEAVTGKAPVNQFIHGEALADAQFQNVVTPNVDTIYSQV